MSPKDGFRWILIGFWLSVGWRWEHAMGEGLSLLFDWWWK